MKNLKNLNGAKALSKNEQKSIKGGRPGNDVLIDCQVGQCDINSPFDTCRADEFCFTSGGDNCGICVHS